MTNAHPGRIVPQDILPQDGSGNSLTALPFGQAEIEELLYGDDRSAQERIVRLQELAAQMREEEPGDFKVLAEYASQPPSPTSPQSPASSQPRARSPRPKTLLIGVSEGAGLSLLAATFTSENMPLASRLRRASSAEPDAVPVT